MTKAPPKLAMRWAGPDDMPGLLDLFQDAYRRWPRVETAAAPLDHLLWKFAETDTQTCRHHAIALDGERIVGAIPLSTRAFLVDGQRMQSATALDVAVREEYRRFGVYMELQHFSRGGYRNSIDFNFGYAGPHPGMARVREKLEGWTLMAHRIDVLAAHVAPPEPFDAGVTIGEADRVDEAIDAFCLEALRPFRLALLRTNGYLNWRYRDERGGGGTLLLARDGGAVAGLAAVRVSNGVGYIAELLTQPGRSEVAGALARECLRRIHAAGAEKARCWLPERHPCRDAVVEAGFSRVKEQRSFTYELLQAPAGSLAFLDDPEAQVHITIGDTDLI